MVGWLQLSAGATRAEARLESWPGAGSGGRSGPVSLVSVPSGKALGSDSSWCGLVV